MRRGFSLLEVMVAIGLLASLMTLILQTQAENIHFMDKGKQLEKVREEVRRQILALERGDQETAWPKEEGVFEPEHPLAGMSYQRSETEEMFMGAVPMVRVTYRITWQQKQMEQSYETFVYAP